MRASCSVTSAALSPARCTGSKGLFEEADAGVLFLDEIGDMPLSLQGRLLRFLDSGEIRPVGDTCVKYLDVRVIAATNRCLRTEIQRGHFREDLYFRLSVISLHLPPLRERRAIIRPLSQYHMRRAAQKLGLPVPELSAQALHVLIGYGWPGNIRELQNALDTRSYGSRAAASRPPTCPTRSVAWARGRRRTRRSTPGLMIPSPFCGGTTATTLRRRQRSASAGRHCGAA